MCTDLPELLKQEFDRVGIYPQVARVGMWRCNFDESKRDCRAELTIVNLSNVFTQRMNCRVLRKRCVIFLRKRNIANNKNNTGKNDISMMIKTLMIIIITMFVMMMMMMMKQLRKRRTKRLFDLTW
jgi:ATP-dependent Zn protease